jgi:hypothetical protein
VIFLDRFPGFVGRKERALCRIARQTEQRQPTQMGAGVSLQSRIAPIDRLGILQCTEPYVHDTKPLDYRVFE